MCKKNRGNIIEELEEDLGVIGNKVTDNEKKKFYEVVKNKRVIRNLKLCEFFCSAVLLLCIFVSLTVIVIFQIDNKFSDYAKAAEVVSTYTSIILGFVAMTVSLIGMVLSFHNTKQTEISNLSSAKEFLNLSHSIGSLRDLEKRLEENLENVSSKIDDLDKQMNELKRLETQLSSIQDNINKMANELRRSIDEKKGEETPGVKNLTVDPEPMSGCNTDEHKS